MDINPIWKLLSLSVLSQVVSRNALVLTPIGSRGVLVFFLTSNMKQSDISRRWLKMQQWQWNVNLLNVRIELRRHWTN